jgi:hypothetical protein
MNRAQAKHFACPRCKSPSYFLRFAGRTMVWQKYSKGGCLHLFRKIIRHRCYGHDAAMAFARGCSAPDGAGWEAER